MECNHRRMPWYSVENPSITYAYGGTEKIVTKLVVKLYCRNPKGPVGVVKLWCWTRDNGEDMGRSDETEGSERLPI